MTTDEALRMLREAATDRGGMRQVLAAHEAEVAARTLREAAEALDETAKVLAKEEGATALSYLNCTLIDARMLRDRADHIEKEG